MAVNPKQTNSSPDGAELPLKLAAVVAPLGVALCLVGPDWLGGTITLVGLALGLFALHRFGRRGPDKPGPNRA